MAHKNRWRLTLNSHRIAGRNQIFYICSEARVSKIAAAIAQPRKIEAQYSDTMSGQGAR
jgi:hypothetical protein